MAEAARPGGSRKTPSEPITISELRARLAEMVGRAEQGEEVVISRGRLPIVKLVPLQRKHPRKLGVLKELMSPQALAGLLEAVDEPLSPRDQAALQGEDTDRFGISRP